MANCTFYTQRSTTTTDMLYGHITQTDEEMINSKQPGDNIQLNVQVTGATNNMNGHFQLVQNYVELFIETTHSLEDVQVLSPVAGQLYPINTVITITGTVA